MTRSCEFVRLLFGSLAFVILWLWPTVSLSYDPARDHVCSAFCDGDPAPTRTVRPSGNTEAIDRYNRAIELSNQANVLAEKHRWQEALSIDPGNTPARSHMLGVQGRIANEECYALNNQHIFEAAVAKCNEALTNYDQALALNPKEGWANTNYDGLRKFLADLNRYLSDESHKQDLIALGRRVSSLVESRHFAEAEDLVGAALKRNPNNAWLHQELGYVYAHQDKWAEALQEDRAAYKLEPTASRRASLVNSLIVVQYNALARKRVEEAVALDKEAFALDPTDRRVRENLNTNLQTLFTEAIDRKNMLAQADAVSDGLRLLPQEPTYHFLQGDLLRSQGKISQAQAAYADAMRISPNVALDIADKWAAHGQPHAAENAYRVDLEWQESNHRPATQIAGLHGLIGETRANNGDYAGAITEFKRAVSIDPDRALLHTLLADTYQKNGNLAEARRELARATALGDHGDLANTVEEKLASADHKSTPRAERSAPPQTRQGQLYKEGGALRQAKATSNYGKRATETTGPEPLTVPGGPNEDASVLAGKIFNTGAPAPAGTAVNSVQSPPSLTQTQRQELIDRDPIVQQYRAQQQASERAEAAHDQRRAEVQKEYDRASGDAKAKLGLDLVRETQATADARSAAFAAKFNAENRAKNVMLGAPDLLPAGVNNP
jgi:tetratricopeptide (TPR) repeat protein